MTSGTRRKASVPPEGFQLKYIFTTLKAKEELGVLSSEVSGLTYLEPRRRTRKKGQVRVVSGHGSEGTQTPICQPLEKVVVWIQEVTERLTKLVHPSDC